MVKGSLSYAIVWRFYRCQYELLEVEFEKRVEELGEGFASLFDQVLLCRESMVGILLHHVANKLLSK